MSRASRVLRWPLPLGFVLAASSCGDSLEPASVLTSVRILGVRSDTPYVRPGATFTTQVLAYDGRTTPANRARPMRLFWFPDVCATSAGGQTEDCYRTLEAKYPRGQDLTPLLTEGERTTFTMPAIPSAAASPTTLPLPTSLVFVAACAGHLEMVGRLAGYPSSVPFACLDRGRQLDAKDFVFAFLRLHVSSDLTNQNPAPSGVTIDGAPLPVDRPLSIPHCAAASIDDCPARKLAVTIGDEAHEIDPTSSPPGPGESAVLREQIWSSFFVSAGKLESESLVLFDARRGRPGKAENEYRGPTAPGDVDLFVVTHDNRSGVAFQSFRLKTE